MMNPALIGGLAALGLGLGAVLLGSGSGAGKVVEITGERELARLTPKAILVVYDSDRAVQAVRDGPTFEFDVAFVPFATARNWANVRDAKSKNVIVAIDTENDRSIAFPASAANMGLAAAWLRKAPE